MDCVNDSLTTEWRVILNQFYKCKELLSTDVEKKF